MTAATIARMRAAVAEHAAAHRAPPPPTKVAALRDQLPPIAQILRGDWHETEHGPVFVRDEWYAYEHEHGALPLSAPLRACPEAVGHLAGAGGAVDPSRLAYFDIETTGLSSGTGTYVIIAGLGSFEPDGFRMRQYFLADIGAERAMLAMLAGDLGRFEGVVTYNGRAFDLPFVQTRMTLARLPFPSVAMPHIDLLHAVRRLYRHRMPGCRLAEAERHVLRIERLDDVPGALIPSLYFDYVRAGRAAPLRGVFRHNAEDVLSLAGILAAAARLLAGEGLDPDDALSAARWWDLARRPDRAMPLYAAALPWLEGSDDWAWAASRQALLLKRARARNQAAPLWRALWRAGDVAAGLELAKHHEHHARDLTAAEAMTLALLAVGGEPAPLERRLARIRRKQERLIGRR